MKNRVKISLRALPAIAAFAAMALCPHKAAAQSDLILSQHWALPTLYNPARAGDTEWLRIRGAGRLQWIGIENAPKSFTGATDLPLPIARQKIGAGVTVSSESLGLFSNLLASVQGAYRFRIGKGHLGIGVQAGYYNTRFRATDAYIPDDDDYHNPDDPSVPRTDLSGHSADFSVGVSFSTPLFHTGLSLMHATSPVVSLETEGSESSESVRYETSLPRTLYFEADGNIELKNTLFLLQPSLLAASDFHDFSAALSLRATYNRFLSFGLGYRWKDAVSIMVGAEFKNFFLGYAYDCPVSPIAKASSGSHEIVAGYSLKINLSGKDRHRHRSIRIM